MVSEQDFYNTCEKHYSFLCDKYMMERVSTAAADWGYEACFKNEKVGVILSFEMRDFYLFAKLVELQNGEVPRHPGEITPATLLYSFDLDDLVTLRSKKDLIPQFEPNTIFDLSLFNQIFAKQAENMKRHAGDVLAGNFSVFSELETIVKKRARDAAFRKWGWVWVWCLGPRSHIQKNHLHASQLLQVYGGGNPLQVANTSYICLESSESSQHEAM